MQGNWNSERETAVIAAKAAGNILLAKFGRAVVRMKGRNDPVSDADVAAQVEIEQAIRRRFPNDGFLGEESAARDDKAIARTWIVDPIDGTINYVHGFPFFAVSICLAVDGDPKVGVIFDPLHGELFVAAAGQGATCNQRPLQVSKAASIGEAMVVVGLPSDFQKQPYALPMFERVSVQCESVRRLGSAALAMAYVAAGRCDAFYSTQIQSWDVAAGVVLVREAGGAIGSIGGGTFRCDDCNNIVATNGLLHAELDAFLTARDAG